jgi:hypothetical protein
VYCAGVIFGNFWCTPECKCKCKKKIHRTAIPGSDWDVWNFIRI